MADVVVFTDDVANDFQNCHTQVTTEKDVIYQFFLDISANTQHLFYKKSINGGASFATAVGVREGAGVKIVGFDVWWEKWTDGIATELIHIVYLFDTGVFQHKSLDPSDDSLTAEIGLATLTALASFNADASWFGHAVSLTVTKTGRLCANAAGRNVAGAAWDENFSTSGDQGQSWTQRTALHEGTAGGNLDRAVLIYGNAADQDDIEALYYDDSALEVSLKSYDASANSWSETSVKLTVDMPLSITRALDASIRHSDGHMLGVVHDTNTAFSDNSIYTYDINGSGSITQKTDVRTTAGFVIGVAIMVDQQSDDVYVFFAESSTANINAVDVFYVKSSDGMTTWGTPVQVSETAAGIYHELWVTLSVGNEGGRLLPAWSDRGNERLLTSNVNSVAFDAVGGAIATPNVGMAQQKILLL